MIGFKEIFYEVLQIRGDLWIAFLLGGAIVALDLFILSLRYKFILHFMKEKISSFDCFNIGCLTQFISYMSPFKVGSILTKPIITKAVSSVSFKKSALASMFEQLFEITWQISVLPILVYIIGKKYFPVGGYQNIMIIMILLMGMIIAMINSKEIIGFLWKLKFIAPRFLRHFLKKKNISKKRVLELIEKSKSYLKNRKLVAVLAIIAFIHIITATFVLDVFLIFFNYKIPFFLVLAGFWASVILGRLSGLPMGLGVKDVTLGAILVSFGVTLMDSVKIVVFIRLVNIITFNLLGIFFLAYNSKKIKNFLGLIRKRRSQERC
ncbi:flippase-like domain-containing protein [Candidatus Woesearchaeota archaeon]|nr:flippase-like domain-containing protein [Candidatus Woesearchaeota archaeon]